MKPNKMTEKIEIYIDKNEILKYKYNLYFKGIITEITTEIEAIRIYLLNYYDIDYDIDLNIFIGKKQISINNI